MEVTLSHQRGRHFAFQPASWSIWCIKQRCGRVYRELTSAAGRVCSSAPVQPGVDSSRIVVSVGDKGSDGPSRWHGPASAFSRTSPCGTAAADESLTVGWSRVKFVAVTAKPKRCRVLALDGLWPVAEVKLTGARPSSKRRAGAFPTLKRAPTSTTARHGPLQRCSYFPQPV
jgi:hypothetical protein